MPGLYLYDGDAPRMARELAPSHRGELEITDLNLAYLAAGSLRAVEIGRGVAGLDSGTHQSLLEAASFIATIEQRQGLKISCPEEIAYRMGYVDDAVMARTIEAMPKSPYREYCRSILEAGR